METNPKLLGICIPTYNRPTDLKECLEYLIPQLKPYSYPVFISDNSTDDRTKRMLSKMTYKHIHYSKNKGKRIYAPNAINSMKMADTQYLWELADDDLAKEGAIDRITSELKSGREFIQINCSLKNKAGRIITERRLPIDKDIIYGKDDSDKVLLNARSGHAGNNAQLIVNRKDALMQLGKLTKAQKENGYIHTILFYGAIAGKTGIMIAKPLMVYQVGTTGGERHINGWAKDYPDALQTLAAIAPRNYSNRAIMEALKQSRKNVLSAIFIARRDCRESECVKLRAAVMENKYLTLREKAFATTIFIIPKSLIETLNDILTDIFHSKT